VVLVLTVVVVTMPAPVIVVSPMVIVVVLAVPMAFVHFPAFSVVVVVWMRPIGSFIRRTLPTSPNPLVTVARWGPISVYPNEARAWWWSRLRDGDRDLPLEKLRDDMERQSMLERLGWTFARVRGSIFFREPDRAMKPIFDKLQSLDIPAKAPADRANGSPSLGELTERVIHRADELREEWSAVRDKRRLRSQPSDSLG
jgi:hypothetical protein